jgi:hypothetical protein
LVTGRLGHGPCRFVAAVENCRAWPWRRSTEKEST